MPNAFDELGSSGPYVPDYLQDEIQFRIDNDLRTIAIPADGVVLGVVGDKNVNHVNFQMPAWYNGFDMSKFRARINFIDASGNANYYTVTDMTVMTPEGVEVTGSPGENDLIYFTWLVDSYATGYVGQVRFNVRLTKFDTNTTPATLLQAFNTQVNTCQVLEGIRLADEITQEQAEDLLFHYSNELGDLAEGYKQDIERAASEILDSMPDYSSLTSMVTSADAALTDLKVGDDGRTYADPGTAVRTQFKHTKDNLDSIHFHTISSKWRADIVDGYRIQSFCYDPTADEYYIIGNAESKNGDAMLWVTKDLYNPVVERSAIVQTGHSNDITFCSKNGMLYVACGYSNSADGGQEGSVGQNVIAEIEASTLTFKRYISIITLQITSRIEYVPEDDYFIIGDFTHCSTYDSTNFSRIKANVFDIGEQTRINPKYGLDPSKTGSQGIATDGTYLYALFFAITSDWTDGFFIEKFALDGTWVATNFYSVDRPGQEAEGIVIKNNTLYIILDGKYFDVYKGMICGDEYKPARWLKDGTDLNDVRVLGKHFSQNGTQTNKLVNVPNIAKNAGILLEVEQAGRTNIVQTLTINNAVPKVLRRLWLEGVGWGKWYMMGVATEYKPNNENIFCYGRVYNAQSCRVLIPIHAKSMSLTRFVVTLYGINGQIATKEAWNGTAYDPTTTTFDQTFADNSRIVVWTCPAGLMCTFYPAGGVSTAVNTPVTGQITMTGSIWS